MRSLIKWTVVVTAFSLFFTGCAVQKRPQTQQEMQQQTRRLRTAPTPTRDTRPAQTMRVADHVADRVADLDTIDSATVMLVGRTAYVGVVFEKDYNGGMTNKVKDQVAKRVRQADPNINRVLVSANPDFVGQLGDYARDVRNGRPIAGLMDNFMDLVQRTFPASR
ncbi:YhcN/YlaJ family sporulation lipoprotein [Desmospora activa]|uniref:YhcN/YlaJ family sporulation lipoprotein n=1 Tax=Desmospora activa DSM 45169 TaxID=1121389 RepID=A0A2T4ZC04_9BACL|nr:YhcN/YlaJ family sporulation lipoprotein [Desmospora activa]PTM59430.1 YhcN/YlaJ family sporulation lipoprotein [Desmospora activa DSM 45169]